MIWSSTWIHTALTHFTTVRRKGVISHVTALMGFTGIVTVCEFTCYFILWRNLWGWTLHLKRKRIFIKPFVSTLLIFTGFVALPLSINILIGRHTCSSRTLLSQNWTVLLKSSICLLCHNSFCVGKKKKGFSHSFVSSPLFCQLDNWCSTSSWYPYAFWLNLHEVVHSRMSTSNFIYNRFPVSWWNDVGGGISCSTLYEYHHYHSCA
jgi:hypothetical protein